MEINIPGMIEKTLKDLIGGQRGTQIARLYRKFWNPINFAIIGLIGVAVYYVTFGIFQALLGWFGSLLSIGIAGCLVWSMSLGPLCHLWGFKKQDTKLEEEVSFMPSETEKT